MSHLGKHIYAMGGMDGHSRLKSVERYDLEGMNIKLIFRYKHEEIS